MTGTGLIEVLPAGCAGTIHPDWWSPPHVNTAGAVFAIGFNASTFAVSTNGWPGITTFQDGKNIHVGFQFCGTTHTHTFACARSLDPGSASWSLVDQANAPIVINQSIGAFDYYYARFNMSASAWATLSAGTVATLVDHVSAVGASGKVDCYASIAVRSDGDIVTVYHGNRTKVMGQDGLSVGIKNSTDGGVTWSARQDADDDTGDLTKVWSIIVPEGNSDSAHFFFEQDGALTARPYNSSDVLGTSRTEAALPALNNNFWSSGSISGQSKIFGCPGVAHNQAYDFRFTAFSDDRSWDAASKIATIAGSWTAGSTFRPTIKQYIFRDKANSEVILLYLGSTSTGTPLRSQALPDDASPYQYE